MTGNAQLNRVSFLKKLLHTSLKIHILEALRLLVSSLKIGRQGHKSPPEIIHLFQTKPHGQTYNQKKDRVILGRKTGARMNLLQ